MRLCYPSVGSKPIVLVLVEDIATSVLSVFPMLVDTGADETCFPASYAAFFGHNNLAPKVVTKKIHGVGGQSQAYIHSVRLVLVDPKKSTPHNFVPAWTSSLDKASFVTQLNMSMGLLGRDVIGEWKQFTLTPTPKRKASKWDIVIRT